MKRTARILVPVGLGVGLALAGVGAAALWIQDFPGTFRAWSARVVSRAEEPAPYLAPQNLETLQAEMQRLRMGQEEPATRLTPQDVEALKAEVKRLQTVQEAWEQRSDTMSRELAALRAQLSPMNRDQASRGREIPENPRDRPAVGHAAEASAINPDEAPAEDESARAEAQTQAQIEAFEGTLVEEDADPGWASAAQLALQEALHGGAMAGFSLTQVDCRTSLCRLELSLDGSRSPGETFEQLIYFAPWNGEAFAQLDEASGVAVVYLSREGYALPQARE